MAPPRETALPCLFPSLLCCFSADQHVAYAWTIPEFIASPGIEFARCLRMAAFQLHRELCKKRASIKA